MKSANFISFELRRFGQPTVGIACVQSDAPPPPVGAIVCVDGTPYRVSAVRYNLSSLNSHSNPVYDRIVTLSAAHEDDKCVEAAEVGGHD